MNYQEFEQHIKETIDPNLYIEDTTYSDLMRININYQGKIKPITVCGFPKMGVKDEFDPNYTDMNARPYPSKEMTEAKIKNFLAKLSSNLDLYE